MAIREFRCRVCNRIDKYGPDAAPVHCGKPMEPGEIGVVRKSDEIAIDIIKLKMYPEIEWLVETPPEEVWEVRVLRPGLPGGWEKSSEIIGWLGRRETSYEYRMAPGIPFPSGTSLTRNGALEAMYLAIEG